MRVGQDTRWFWETCRYGGLTVKRFSAMLESLTQNWWFCLGCRPEVVSTHFATCDMIVSTAEVRGDAGAGPSSSMDGSGSEPTTAGGGRSVCGCCSWSSCCCCDGTAGRSGRGNEDIYLVHEGWVRLQAQPPPQMTSLSSTAGNSGATRTDGPSRCNPTGSGINVRLGSWGPGLSSVPRQVL